MILSSRRQFLRTVAIGATLGLAATHTFGQTDEASRPATPRWPVEFLEGDYHFHADFDPRSQSTLIPELLRLREDISRQLQIRVENEPVHLLLFSTAGNYRNYMHAYFPELPERRALYIKRRGPGMVFAYKNREMEIDLRHETTHALLNASLAFVPLWLDEGLAEYYEIAAGQRATHSDHLRMVRLRALLGQARDISELEAIEDLANMGGGEYRDSWSWIHFLLHHSEATRGCLVRYLQDIQSGILPGPFSRRLSADVPDHRQMFLKHFRHFS